MAAKVICMASAKGGAGKTVLTATFGVFLAAIGKKVLLIDTDAATNGLTLLFLKETMLQAEYAISEERQPRGAYEVQREGEGEIVKLQNGTHLLPATYRFSNTGDLSAPDFAASLKGIVKLKRNDYDYIFLDAQAGAEPYAQAAMSKETSDEVIIVSEYDPMSAAGIERLKGLLREDLIYTRTWVLLNKMLPEFVKSFSDFMEIAKYLAPIPWNADVVRAYARRRLAIDVENGNEYTLAVIQTLESLLGDEISADIAGWKEQRAEAIRQPLAIQYSDLEKELAGLFRARASLNQKHKFSQIIRWGSIITVLFAISMTIASSLKLIDINSQSVKSVFFSSSAEAFLMWVMIVFVFVVVTTIFMPKFLRMFNDPNDQVKMLRIDRQEQVLKERLSRLESLLRAADLAELLRAKDR